jgi:hypothetical protein
VLTVDCTGGPDTITLDHGSAPPYGDGAVINGEFVAWDFQYDHIEISGASGGLTTYLHTNVKPLYVITVSPTDVVNVGYNGSLAGIAEALVVESDNDGSPMLNLDDSADTATHGNVVVTQSSTTGLAPATMSYGDATPSQLNISTGTGTNTVNVQSTPNWTNFFGTFYTPTALIGHSGATTVNVGNAGSLAGIQGALDISNPPSYTTLTVDDSADSTVHNNVVVTDSSITGLAPAIIGYRQSDLRALNINTGTGTNTVNVQSTPASALHTALVGHSVATTVNVGNAGSLSGIQSTLDLSNATSGTTVVVDDSADPTGRTATFSVSASTETISGLAPAPITYTASNGGSVTVTGGMGGNVFHVQGTLSGGTLSLNGGRAGDFLWGPDRDTTWYITGTNAGNITGGVSFTGMTDLIGGAAADAFVFSDGASVASSINGGGGTNTLDYSAYASSNVMVNLNPQVLTATGVGDGINNHISNIQNVIGANGGAAGSYNLLIGNGGNVLTGGSGRRNLLVAGYRGGSTLRGGNLDDLLIAGGTAYDADTSVGYWLQIAAYWAGTDDFATRVNNLYSGSGVPPLDESTVHAWDLGPGNTLIGNGERGLIYTDLRDNISGFDPGSVTFQIHDF